MHGSKSKHVDLSMISRVGPITFISKPDRGPDDEIDNEMDANRGSGVEPRFLYNNLTAT